MPAPHPIAARIRWRDPHRRYPTEAVAVYPGARPGEIRWISARTGVEHTAAPGTIAAVEVIAR